MKLNEVIWNVVIINKLRLLVLTLYLCIVTFFVPKFFVTKNACEKVVDFDATECGTSYLISAAGVLLLVVLLDKSFKSVSIQIMCASVMAGYIVAVALF